MKDIPDAPWITYYEEYRDAYYGYTEESEEDDEYIPDRQTD